jgi:hypothetical protein
MKFVKRRPFADPDIAARKLVEIANSVDAAQDGRIYIERINAPFVAAGVSGKGQDAEHGCSYGERNFQRTLRLRASSEAQRQLAFDVEATTQRAVLQLTGFSANNLN